MLAGRQALVAEEEYLIGREGVEQLVERGVGQRVEVEILDFGADHGG
jgi:hypothetical protein